MTNNMILRARFLLLVSLLWAGRLLAQEAQLPEDTTATTDMGAEEQTHFKSIAGQLRCPTCTGLSVLDSDAPFSLQIQALVKEQIKQGKREDEIISYFTERYGPWILREPPKRGVNLLAWLFPIGLMVFGPLAIWFFVWRRKHQVTNGGIRSAEALLAEFEEAVAALRQKQGVL